MADKKWYDSKTFWVNGLGFLGGILTALSGQLAAGATISVLTVINLVLRTLTKDGVSF